MVAPPGGQPRPAGARGPRRRAAADRPGALGAAAALRCRRDRGVEPAHPEQRREHGGERRPGGCRGTDDWPLLFGRAELERGDFVFEGNRYLVDAGGSIDFANPSPHRAVLRPPVRDAGPAPGQPYRIDHRVKRHDPLASFALSSDPPLPEVDIISLLVGQNVDLEDAELRSLRSGAAKDRGGAASSTAWHGCWGAHCGAGGAAPWKGRSASTQCRSPRRSPPRATR